jgi:hypothetical protein
MVIAEVVGEDCDVPEEEASSHPSFVIEEEVAAEGGQP